MIGMSKISEVYVFVFEDSGPNDEGAIGLHSQKGNPGPWSADGRIWMPICAIDPKRLAELTPLVAGIGNQLGKRVHLVKFTRTQDMAVINSERVRAA